MSRILLVEDQRDLAFGLSRNLEFDGHEVEVAEDGRRALDLVAEGRHDLIILDLMLPGVDGMTVLERLRSSGQRTPVLILTARGEERDKVRGLRGGADDYLTKPFGVAELLARVDALLRRAAPDRAPEPDGPYRFGDVLVDVSRRSVHRAGSVVPVAPRELDLLIALLRAGGEACSREDLLRDVWGHRARVATRTVDTHIGELRRKLEDDPARPAHILTVRKHGYRLDPEGVR